MLRIVRQVLALLFFVGITLLFLDFSGTLPTYLGWMSKLQFLPALLALNVGIVFLWVLLTLLFGRMYCSVVCPLGVFQDVVSWFSGRRKKKRYRFTYSPSKKWLRYGVLVLFAVAMVAGLGAWASLLAPYSAYGRMVSHLLQPIYMYANNVLASWSESMGNYWFYEVDVWMKGVAALCVALLTFGVLFVLAWRNGRTYCNTVCPVGTVLGLLSRYSLFRPVVDTSKCNGCNLCARRCKASCIDSGTHQVDYSRCVACLDCVEICKRGAMQYRLRTKGMQPVSGTQREVRYEGGKEPVDQSKRLFLSTAAFMTVATAVKSQEKKVDGGLAVIQDKQVPERGTKIVPPGALSIRNFENHCTACLLCVSACPNQVLRPSGSWGSLLQPEMSYERGYCRPECTKCSEVCPAGAIRPISREDKASTSIGHAVWIKKNCVPLTDGRECGNCARHCPVSAITMVNSVQGDDKSVKIPAIDVERCIGCGACENLCPARPFSAIYVEGHRVHHLN